jgi:hypothetical protein
LPVNLFAAIVAGGVMNIEDAYCNPLFSPDVDVRLGYRTNSILCCSIADMSGKNIAVLQVRLSVERWWHSHTAEWSTTSPVL